MPRPPERDTNHEYPVSDRVDPTNGQGMTLEEYRYQEAKGNYVFVPSPENVELLGAELLGRYLRRELLEGEARVMEGKWQPTAHRPQRNRGRGMSHRDR